MQVARKKEEYLIANSFELTNNRMSKAQIKEMLEKQTMVKIESYDESVFATGKIEKDFFTYLIILLEDYNGICFLDEELEIDNFDTVNAIYEMIENKKQ